MAAKPLMLYHGTDAETARNAKVNGLIPRTDTGRDANHKVAASHPDMVYLTRLYAPYYAHMTTHARNGWRHPYREKDRKYGIVEVDPRSLLQGNFYPDEDFIEWMHRDHKQTASLTLGERLVFYRERLDQYKDQARNSLAFLGNIAHRGVIPPSVIRRVVIFDPEANPPMAEAAHDVEPSPIVTKMAGPRFELLTRWFMGEPTTVEEFTAVDLLSDDEDDELPTIAAIRNRSGFTFL